MTWVAAAVAGGSALLGYAASQNQAKAAEKAGKGAAAAAKYQADLQQQQYEQTRQDQAPWRGAGELGLGALTYGLGLSPTGYVPGMSQQTMGAFGQNALAYGNASNLLAGGDQWEVIAAPAHRQNMQVRNTVTGEVRDVPLTTERDTSSLKREGVANALANGWQLSGTESVPQIGSMLTGPKSMPTDAQIAEAQQRMSQASGMGAGGTAGAPGNGLLQTGMGAGDLMRRFGMADFQEDPGYAFRQQQGQQQIDRQAAARGGLISGAALKATQRFGQDLASQEYQNAYNRFNTDQTSRFNRLASLAGIGQTANNALQTAGQNFANAMTSISANSAENQANAQLAAGAARSSGYQGIANALAGGYANYQRQQQPQVAIPQGYQMGSGYLGNTVATNQGYQPLDYATANAGYYD